MLGFLKIQALIFTNISQFFQKQITLFLCQHVKQQSISIYFSLKKNPKRIIPLIYPQQSSKQPYHGKRFECGFYQYELCKIA